MPVSGGIKLVDANVWLGLTFSDHLFHSLAKNWFDIQPEGSCAFCRITQMALLRHLTNAKIMGQFVQNQMQAWKNFDLLAGDGRVVFLNEPPTLEAELRNLTQSDSPSHAVWTDAYLAAFAIASQCQLVTCDQGLDRFKMLSLLVLKS
jgi:toxin-antitoxin system PIN domain toxin